MSQQRLASLTIMNFHWNNALLFYVNKVINKFAESKRIVNYVIYSLDFVIFKTIVLFICWYTVTIMILILLLHGIHLFVEC